MVPLILQPRKVCGYSFMIGDFHADLETGTLGRQIHPSRAYTKMDHHSPGCCCLEFLAKLAPLCVYLPLSQNLHSAPKRKKARVRACGYATAQLLHYSRERENGGHFRQPLYKTGWGGGGPASSCILYIGTVSQARVRAYVYDTTLSAGYIPPRAVVRV